MPRLTFGTFVWRVVASHLVTYFAFGLIASTLFDYRRLYAETDLRHLMRGTDTAWVAAGPSLQVVRAAVFAVVLWPIADRIVRAPHGALMLYGLMLGLAVFGTAGPSPGSLEGLLYTTLPVRIHLLGLPEVIAQTGAFSLLLVAWHRKPARWMDVAALIGIVLIALMSAAGVLAALGVLRAPRTDASIIFGAECSRARRALDTRRPS